MAADSGFVVFVACWLREPSVPTDTDYNEESFFVHHVYFLGSGDPYGTLKTSLKAEINEDHPP